MGKAKKLKVSGTSRHAPLDDQIKSDDFAVPSSRPSKDRKRKAEEDVDKFVDGRLSEKILSQARQQVKDLEAEELLSKGTKSLNKPNLSSVKNVSSDEESDGEDTENVALLSDGGFDGQG